MSVLDNIKKFAAEKNLSLAQIEKRANLGNGTIGKYEKSSPTVKTLEEIAKALEISVEDLVK